MKQYTLLFEPADVLSPRMTLADEVHMPSDKAVVEYASSLFLSYIRRGHPFSKLEVFRDEGHVATITVRLEAVVAMGETDPYPPPTNKPTDAPGDYGIG
jgi:hypothetical protein